jgi:hypothetical protein
VEPTKPTSLPGLTKGMARISWSKGGRTDIGQAGAVPRVAPYARTIGPPGQMSGILQAPQVPGVYGRQGQRERFLAWMKTGKRAPGGSYDQLLQSVQGGGKPLGPAYAGYLSQLARTLLEGM